MGETTPQEPLSEDEIRALIGIQPHARRPVRFHQGTQGVPSGYGAR